MFKKNAAPASAGGYTFSKSLRLRASASAYLSRTPASASNQRTFTWSAWVKRANFGTEGNLFEAGLWTYGNQIGVITFAGSDGFAIAAGIYGVNTGQNMLSTQVFRDPSAWYHMVVAVDTTQATDTNRIKMYVNGTQITAFTQVGTYNIYPSQNYQYNINSVIAHRIGNDPIGNQYDGYIAENYFIDGQQLTPSSFGETNSTTGVWQPVAYTGTYGTNGFYLPFTDIATTSGSNAGLGKDFSGNGNYWTTNNISVTSGSTYDSMTDVPTLTSATVANYCVLNPINIGSGSSLNSANLNFSVSSTAGNVKQAQAFGTFGVTSGKYYWEVVWTTSAQNFIGVCNSSQTPDISPYSASYIRGFVNSSGGLKADGQTSAAYGTTWTTGDVIGVALDMDTGSIAFYKNNVSQGTAYTNLSGSTWFPYITGWASGETYVGYFNFGQRPFTYTPPTGYVALNTYNLPTSTIVKGNSVMDATLYTGNGSTLSVTNAAGFYPDLVWYKDRSNGSYNHGVFDKVRGVNNFVATNSTAAEVGGISGVSAFNSNGFTLGSDAGGNTNGDSYVAWQWNAGSGTQSSNTNGSVTATVSVNSTAGFSIANCTTPATNTNFTVGHGLGAAPAFIIVKNRTSTNNWTIYHQSTGAGGYLLFNTSAFTANTDTWANTAPTSTVWSSNTPNWWATSQNLVAYSWLEIAGFSKFGSYTGNGSANGPFVYLGFRPKWFLTKRTDTTSDWVIIDTSRAPYNAVSPYIVVNTTAAENNYTGWDLVSNGMKLRNTDAGINANGGTYIYAAFAENPFKNALAR